MEINIKNRFCPLCGREIGLFKNSISEKEFKISGLCQTCQDMIFGIDGVEE